MPSQNKKKMKKNKVTKVKIKKEPVDINSLIYYVDDRVELIKQTFLTLKSKRIKTLAPDFLQSKSLDKLQEYCLNEVLGISKKRLTSIINATKCPSDTESSNSDSDVEKIEEHISLDDISDDSNDVALVNNKNNKNNNTTVNNKEMTVLELLELQARARAIRSQLALEPITKIELDSDNENETDKKQSIHEVSSSKSKSTNSGKKEKHKIIAEKSIETEKKDNVETEKKEPTKRIKLKRNFRVRRVGDDLSEDEQNINNVVQLQNNNEEISPKKQKNVTESVNNEKAVAESNDIEETVEKNVNSNCSSPEVITMFPSPVTLYILSDSEDEFSKKKTSEEADSSFSAIEESHREPEKIIEEPEDGEILEEEDKMAIKIETNAEKNDQNKDTKTLENTNKQDDSSSSSSIDLEMEGFDYEFKDNTDDDEDGVDDSSKLEQKIDESEAKDDEAIINKQPEVKENIEAVEVGPVEDFDNDVINIDDSDDNEPVFESVSDNEKEGARIGSWNSRWLESSKVTKILATSRLGNKVRGNIKKKKITSDEKTGADDERKAESPAPEEPTIEHELGSVQHYRVLISKEKD